MDLSPICPDPVERVAMTQRWDTLTFVHFEYEPSDVQSLLPAALRVDSFEGSAWVGLVPFEMQQVRLRGLPHLPGATNFCETNVRTYVIGPDGGRGVYFFSLDASPLMVSVFARATYRLPYYWSAMALHRDVAERSVEYRCRRRLSGHGTVSSHCTVRVGGPVDPSPLDVFLTARWGLYRARGGGGLSYAPIHHAPWPLYDAVVESLDDGLVAAAGLPEPEGRMEVRHSPGVDVRIGLPRRA